MALIKYTKIELAKYNKKKALSQKYLPTLQLKKMLLTAEVAKARLEVRENQEEYEKLLTQVRDHAKLLTDPATENLLSHLQVKKLVVDIENIAGIEIPKFKELIFVPTDADFISEPIWFESMIGLLRDLKRAQKRLRVSQEKVSILEKELRVVSIRVNLFEKRIIPETTQIINKIKVFLSDQDLQAVASAKVSKNKILLKKKKKALNEG